MVGDISGFLLSFPFEGGKDDRSRQSVGSVVIVMLDTIVQMTRK
jgi:hypothetical protein